MVNQHSPRFKASDYGPSKLVESALNECLFGHGEYEIGIGNRIRTRLIARDWSMYLLQHEWLGEILQSKKGHDETTVIIGLTRHARATIRRTGYHADHLDMLGMAEQQRFINLLRKAALNEFFDLSGAIE